VRYKYCVRSAIRVAAPPPKPLLIYDGDCNFCKFWIRRWQYYTGDAIDYAPFQDSSITTQFPELSRTDLASAVHLVEPGGNVISGAEAVFHSLSNNPRWQRLAHWYSRFATFAQVTEWSYAFIARHRTFSSFLTRLGWGKNPEPPSYQATRWIFLRVLGIVYLFAFASLATQIIGLVGSDGIIPIKNVLANVTQNCDANHIGLDRYHLFPTLCWFNSSDAFLHAQCIAGILLACLVIIGIAPALCLAMLWLLYLSLTTASGDFLGFQWDNLLLETGFLAIFFAPLQLLPHRPAKETAPSRIAHLLLLWLLFRLMFESGFVKLASGDLTWRHLTALTFHYQTQPLPTWIGWYAHQAPVWFQRFSCAAMFTIELATPFFLFAPRRLRQWAASALIVLQILILLTGNYTFFNLLTIALCLLAFDDAAFRRFIPQKWKSPQTTPQNKRHWPRAIIVPVACVVLLITTVDFLAAVRVLRFLPPTTVAVLDWFAPFRSFNNYGLFAVMTTPRNEIEIEGSDDGVNWRAYGFKYKPGALDRRPAFVAPFQPRLDWQMWFAALGDYRHNPWFVSFCLRLLQGSPDVLALLKENTFPARPPMYIRARLYEYRFTDFATRRKTGDWWQREYTGDYLPVISLRDFNQ